MFSTIYKAVVIAWNKLIRKEEEVIYLNKEKPHLKYHRGACNMDPHDVSRMTPFEKEEKGWRKKRKTGFKKNSSDGVV